MRRKPPFPAGSRMSRRRNNGMLDLLEAIFLFPWLSDDKHLRRWELIGLAIGAPFLLFALAYLIIALVSPS
jgi:hypothetical protein